MATWAPASDEEERETAMTITVGDRVPDVKVFTFGDKGPEATTSAEVLGSGKVVLFDFWATQNGP